MKIALGILSVFFCLSQNLDAQVVLTQSSYPISVTGTDSLRMTTYASPFPSLAFSASGMWDLSTVVDSAPVFFEYRLPTFTGYQFADSSIYRLFGYAGFNYQGNVQSSILGGGLLDYGLKIQPISYSLFPITSTITDSLFIDSQLTLYSSPHTKIGFPAAYTSSWSSSYVSDVNFHLSWSPFYSHSPGVVRRYTTEVDSVLGWGKLRIRDAGGSSSPYLSVLQVKTIITTTDSFLIGGTPFPVVLTSGFNVVQGTTTTTYLQNYYRPEEVTALAQVTFTDATYSQAKSATTHVQRLSDVGVPNLMNNNKFEIYPNPVSGNSIFVSLPGTGAWSYRLSDMNGIVTGSGVLETSGNKGQVTLPGAIAPGSYYLKLENSSQQSLTRSIEILR
jgi:hypothetical protein